MAGDSFNQSSPERFHLRGIYKFPAPILAIRCFASRLFSAPPQPTIKWRFRRKNRRPMVRDRCVFRFLPLLAPPQTTKKCRFEHKNRRPTGLRMKRFCFLLLASFSATANSGERCRVCAHKPPTECSEDPAFSSTRLL